MTNYRPTELQINSTRLGDNVLSLRRKLLGKARMMAVVKANAYGHGLARTAKTALACGADALGVATVEEGVDLRDAGLRAPVLVMGGATEAGARTAAERNLALALFDEGTLLALQSEAQKRDTVAHAHIKIDTGMTRLGVLPSALDALLGRLKSCPNVKLEGIFTHFADAFGDPEFTHAQNEVFQRAVKRVRALGYRPIAHAAASEAMLLDETLWHDMVRPGIALYGASVRHLCEGLMPAQQLVTKPVRIQRVAEGATVGYGRTCALGRESVVMTLPIGYGDGYPRCLGNRAAVLVKGVRAPIVGRVCMDMVMADITEIPGVTLADEVVLLGEQGDQRITPDELAALAGTIPYEIMLGFTQRVPMTHL